MGKIDLASKYKKYNELSGFEKFIMKTCCYINTKAPTGYTGNQRTMTPEEEKQDLERIVQKTRKVYEMFLGAELFNMVRGKKVLDFGCGYGEYVIGMALLEQCEVDGIDINDRDARSSKYIDIFDIKNARLFTGDSTKLFQDGSYDVVISYDSFEHFEEPDVILKEISRLTKTGGKVIVKFGPTWMSPLGRHMSGTFRKDRPWIHLLIPEKNMMRIHSVMKGRDVLYEQYKDLVGGLNKMTIAKAKRIIKANKNLKIEKVKIFPMYGIKFLTYIPLIKELCSTGVYFECTKL